jgi:hypothetical protein
MNNPANDDDFMPVPFKNGGLRSTDTCDSVALSFFETLEGARDKFRLLREREDADSRYGTHIGEVTLRPSDGLAGPLGKHGHFNLHENANASFVGRVSRYHEPSDASDEDAEEDRDAAT